MRIGLDGYFLSSRRGIGNFIYNLLTGLTRIAVEHEFVVFVNSWQSAEMLPKRSGLNTRVVGVNNYPLWEQVILPLEAARCRLDMLHCPANTGPLFLGGDVKLVVTIHDVIYLLPKDLLPISSSLFQRAGRIYRRYTVPRLVKHAAMITTDSEHSKRDIVKYLRVPAQRIRVVHMAAGPVFRRLPPGTGADRLKSRYDISGKFVLTLGGTDPRKNTASVLRAFLYFKALSGSPHRLVMVGLQENEQKQFSSIGNEIGNLQDIVFTGFVPEEDLVALYNAADVFVYPSLYEGFGLPVLEAMACGTPVVASAVASIPEVAGDAALLVDPTDERAVAESIARAIMDGALRRTLIDRGTRRVAEFSWEKAASELLRVYEECYAG